MATGLAESKSKQHTSSPVTEGHDLGKDANVISMDEMVPLEDGQAEIYARAFQGFQAARENLQSLLVAGGFANKDIIKAEFEGDNKHFVTRPSVNGAPG